MEKEVRDMQQKDEHRDHHKEIDKEINKETNIEMNKEIGREMKNSIYKKEQLITIIVPVYNVAKYLDKCIKGIMNQTYKNLEILLVNDGSTDESGEICHKYEKQDSRIRVIDKINGGSSSARNVGIKDAKGEYIGFLDADDWAEEGMYEALYQTAVRENATIVQVMSRDYDEAGTLLKDAYKSTGQVTYLPKEEMFRLLMLHLGDSSFCTKLIKGDFARRFLFTENRLNEDFELILRMLSEVEGVYSIEKAYYNILIRQGSNQRSGFKPHLYEAVIDNSELALSMMEESFPTCRQEALRFYYFQRLDYLLHIPVEQMKSENIYYQKVWKEIRKGRADWKENTFLTTKEKRNLTILSLCPRGSKILHSLIMKIRR